MVSWDPSVHRELDVVTSSNAADRAGGRPPAIEIASVTQVFESSGAPDGFLALSDLSIDFAPSEFACIVGPSGCGKSTLLSLIAGILPPSTGTVAVGGKPVRGIRSDVGFIFQKDALLPWRTAAENVGLALKYRGGSRHDVRDEARAWLARVGLAGFEDAYPHQLSGGMRKRVSIAATLVYQPPILLMDEPFSALDVQTRDVMENDLLQLWDGTGQTVVFVTHDLEEAIGLSDRVIVMSASPGRVKGDYRVDLSRPRDLLEIQVQRGFADLYARVWSDLRSEVRKAQPTVTKIAGGKRRRLT
jgi:NitT/TauT family transport system ATP-binding protein